MLFSIKMGKIINKDFFNETKQANTKIFTCTFIYK